MGIVLISLGVVFCAVGILIAIGVIPVDEYLSARHEKELMRYAREYVERTTLTQTTGAR